MVCLMLIHILQYTYEEKFLKFCALKLVSTIKLFRDQFLVVWGHPDYARLQYRANTINKLSNL